MRSHLQTQNMTAFSFTAEQRCPGHWLGTYCAAHLMCPNWDEGDEKERNAMYLKGFGCKWEWCMNVRN